MAGWFVTFEGPEGAGKSTQIRLLADHLRSQGQSVVATREPGGTAIGEQIRSILLSRDSGAMAPETEALLHTAARAQHVVEVIRPALDRVDVVLCDRFVESTLAYQGGGRGLPIDQLRELQQLATGGLAPDLKVLLDLDVDVGLGRRRREIGSANRMDDEELAFHRRVRDAYRTMAVEDPAGWVVIDGDQSVGVVAAAINEAVSSALARAGFDLEIRAPVKS